MLREGWNFHGDIAIPLEARARRLWKDEDRPIGKIYDADAIQAETFAEVLMITLREKTQFRDDDEINDFIKDCASYLGVRGDEIKPDVANRLYERWKELFKR